MKQIIFTLFTLLSIVSIKAQELKIDTEKAVVKFNYVIDKATGTISGIKAKMVFDLSDVSKSHIEGTADVTTLETGNTQRDSHLQSSDFFDTKKFPIMKFKSTSFEKTAEGYKMIGKLTICDVEKEIEIKFTYENNVFEGKSKIYSNDFGIAKKKKREDSAILLKFIIPVK